MGFLDLADKILEEIRAEYAPGSSGPNLEAQPRDREPGLERMRQTWREISSLWSEIETSGGSLAWEWILRGSPHGAKIQAAQGQVDAIGSQGNPAVLASACDAWVSAWRDGIEGWKKVNGRTRAEQGSFNLGQHRAKELRELA